MNFNEIKKLMGPSGRLIIVENDKPAYIIIRAEEFLALENQNQKEPAPAQMTEVFQSGGSQAVPASPVGYNPSLKTYEEPADRNIAGMPLPGGDHETVQLQDVAVDDLGLEDLAY